MSVTIELPRYHCHKQVHALKIKAIIPNPRGYELHFDNERYAPIEVDVMWFGKHEPHAGGYFVVYSDGYKSYSPAVAFEQGYTLASELPPVQADLTRLMSDMSGMHPEEASFAQMLAEQHIAQIQHIGPIARLALYLAVGICQEADKLPPVPNDRDQTPIGYRCVGGPHDGQYMARPPGETRFSVPVLPELGAEATEITYVLEDVPFLGKAWIVQGEPA